LLNVYSEQWAPNVLPAGHPNAATRRFTDADLAALNAPRDAVHVLSAEHTARYWRVLFVDIDNARGYVQLGRCVLAPRYGPAYNYSVGAEFGFLDNTEAVTSESGTRYYDEKPYARTFAFSLTNLADAEAITVARDMIEALGRARQFYLVQTPDDAINLQRRSFLATLRQLSPVTILAAGYSSVPFIADEVQ